MTLFASRLVRAPALDLTALSSLRTLYVEAVLTERRTRHEHYALIAPRLLANIHLPSQKPEVVVLHVHAAPLPAVHAWVHPAAPTELLVDVHGAKDEEKPSLEHGVREWARKGAAREARIEVSWRHERVPVFGLEERFMERCV